MEASADGRRLASSGSSGSATAGSCLCSYDALGAWVAAVPAMARHCADVGLSRQVETELGAEVAAVRSERVPV